MISKSLTLLAVVLSIVSTINSLPLQNGMQEQRIESPDSNGKIMVSLNLKLSIDNKAKKCDSPKENGKPDMNNTKPGEPTPLPSTYQPSPQPSTQSSPPPPSEPPSTLPSTLPSSSAPTATTTKAPTTTTKAATTTKAPTTTTKAATNTTKPPTSAGTSAPAIIG